jgi:hypothetical protein
MPRLREGFAPAALTLTLLAIIGVAGVVDHTIKIRRINRAQVSEWYCNHHGTRCGGPSSAGIEDAWNRRELGYQVALVVIAVTGATLTVRRMSRGRE